MRAASGWTIADPYRSEMLDDGHPQCSSGHQGLRRRPQEIGRITRRAVEQTLVQSVPGTRSVFAERTAGGYFLELHAEPRGVRALRHDRQHVQDVIDVRGGRRTTSRSTVEGRERYSINVRYQRGSRSDLDSLERVLVPARTARRFRSPQLADIRLSTAPASSTTRTGRSPATSSSTWPAATSAATSPRPSGRWTSTCKLPPGYHLEWSRAVSSTSSALQPGCSWWCPLPCSSSSSCST